MANASIHHSQGTKNNSVQNILWAIWDADGYHIIINGIQIIIPTLSSSSCNTLNYPHRVTVPIRYPLCRWQFHTVYCDHKNCNYVNSVSPNLANWIYFFGYNYKCSYVGGNKSQATRGGEERLETRLLVSVGHEWRRSGRCGIIIKLPKMAFVHLIVKSAIPVLVFHQENSRMHSHHIRT